MAGQIRVVGASWCHDTTDTREHLDSLGIEYEFQDVDQDAAAARWVESQNGGKRKLPTVDVAGQILSVPDEAELDDALRAKGMLPA